jgi:hypothetical protein
MFVFTRPTTKNYTLIVIHSLHDLWDLAEVIYIFYLVFNTSVLRQLKMIIL